MRRSQFCITPGRRPTATSGDVVGCDVHWLHERRALVRVSPGVQGHLPEKNVLASNCSIVTDNLCAHHKIKVMKWCALNKVHMVFLPPDVTHFMNPLDFMIFKSKLTKEVQSGLVFQHLIHPDAILDATLEAQVHLTLTMIKASWEGVGL